MIEPLITIQYFLGSEIISMSIPSEELPTIAGHATYWRQDVLDNDALERTGRKLKARISKSVMPTTPFPSVP